MQRGSRKTIQIEDQESWLVFGASRGFGRNFCLNSAKALRQRGVAINWTLVARKMDGLESLAQELSDLGQPSKVYPMDVSKTECEDPIQELLKDPVHRIFYFIGGGPYGEFSNKAWKDHEWSLRTSLIFPMRLTHASFAKPEVKQRIFIGSAIAESKADPKASSYAAAKHGLKGWISSCVEESDLDFRLYSPGYIDTNLLPQSAEARRHGKVWEPSALSRDLLEWLEVSPSPHFHRIKEPYQ